MNKYIVIHDVGISGNKTELVDIDGLVHGKCSHPYITCFPNPGLAKQYFEE